MLSGRVWEVIHRVFCTICLRTCFLDRVPWSRGAPRAGEGNEIVVRWSLVCEIPRKLSAGLCLLAERDVVARARRSLVVDHAWAFFFCTREKDSLSPRKSWSSVEELCARCGSKSDADVLRPRWCWCLKWRAVGAVEIAVVCVAKRNVTI